MKLRRWHFDVAIFVGLGVFVAAYLLAQPRAMWRVPLGKLATLEIGFSSDGRTFYTLKDVAVNDGHRPRPMIQGWNVATGVLVSEMPLQVPEEELAKIGPLSFESDIRFRPYLIPGSDHFQVRIQGDALRLFELETGRHIPLATTTGKWFWYLMQNPADGHHWGIAAGNSAVGEAPRLVDLATGETLHTFSISPGRYPYSCNVTRDKKYVIMVWCMSSSSTPIGHQLQIVPMDRWNESQFLPLEQCDYIVQVESRRDRLFVFTLSREHGAYVNQTQAFRFDPAQGVFQKEKVPEWLGSRTMEAPYLFDDVVVMYSVLRSDDERPQIVERIRNFSRQFGIQFRQLADEQNFFVHDLQCGRVLRQLTKINDVGECSLLPRWNAEYLTGIQYEMNDEKFLLMYRIPHHLSERSLHFLQYAAWVLVVPWPGRYLIRRKEAA